MLNPFEPRLKHNRAEFDRLRRWKRVTLLVSIVLTLGTIAVVPSSMALGTAFTFVAVTGVVFFYLEARRYLIFRRDVREREGPHTG